MVDQRNAVCVRCGEKFWHPLAGGMVYATYFCSQCLTALRYLARDIGFLPRVEQIEHECLWPAETKENEHD